MNYIAPVQVKLTEEKREEFKRVAKENKETPSEVLRKMIDQYIEENKN